MAELINPEYKIKDDTNYLPQGGGYRQMKETTIKVIANRDGTNGVSMYDGDTLIVNAQASGKNNMTLTIDEVTRNMKINVDADRVSGGEGIKIEDLGNGIKVVSQDKEWLSKHLTSNEKMIRGLRGEKGVIVEDDVLLQNGKVAKLDDEYIINQGEY